MFGRKKQETHPAQAAHPQREGAKNRPTPKRKDQEAARKRPLVHDNRKEAKKADRQARREASSQMRSAMLTGDEKHFPARDKGPERRYVRDVVDARFNLGEYLLPLMLVVLVFSFVNPTIASYGFLAIYLIVFAAIFDAVLLWRRTKRAILERFGPDTTTKGLGMYLGMRAFQLRRSRLPKPGIGRGDAPR